MNCEIYSFTLAKPCPLERTKNRSLLLSITGGGTTYVSKQDAEVRIARIERLTTPARSAYPHPTHFFYGELMAWFFGTESHMERSGHPPAFHTSMILGTFHCAATNGNLIGGKLIPAPYFIDL